MRTIAFLVLTYNKFSLTNLLIDDINSQQEVRGFRKLVIVFDNGSAKPFETSNPNIDILRSDRNIGYAAGMNKLLLRAIDLKADSFVLLNNDIRLPLTFLSEHCFRLDHFDVIVFPTYDIEGARESDPFGSVSRLTGRGFKRSQLIRFSPFIRYFNFSVIILSRSIVEKSGHFDEKNYFLYWEDVDYSMRISRKNPSILESRMNIYHQCGATTTRYRYDTAFHYTRSNIIFLRKFPIALFGPSAIVIIAFVKVMVAFLRGDYPLAKAIGRGIISGITHKIGSER